MTRWSRSHHVRITRVSLEDVTQEVADEFFDRLVRQEIEIVIDGVPYVAEVVWVATREMEPRR